MPHSLQRIAVLYSELSGYIAACLKALKERYGVELLVVHWPPVQDAPFDEQIFSGFDARYLKTRHSVGELEALVRAYEPQVLLISGWIDRDYLRIARVFKRRGVPVVATSDTQWHGTLRQYAGCLLAPWLLHPAIDVLWVAGERQQQFARHLGYEGARCWGGLYACDWPRFATARPPSAGARPPTFLFVGRLAAQKGVDVLIQAYEAYRAMVRKPWSLLCAGTGDLHALLEDREGVIDRGFVQPGRLPALMHEASAFILPSRKEPWGVVLQEAAASGLPLVCSDAAGAVVHLLQDRYNGYLFKAGDARHLAQCMIQMTALTDEERAEMGNRSFELSKQFTPQRWADTLVQGVAALQDTRGVESPGVSYN